MAEKAEECPRCHTRREEWEQDPDVYVAEAVHCPGCERVDWEAESWSQEHNTKGKSIRLVRKDQYTRPKLPPGFTNNS